MRTGYSINDDCVKDRSSSSEVQGNRGRSHGHFLTGLLIAASAVFTAEFLNAAPRSPVSADRTITRVVDEFFNAQPDYEIGDLISRSQADKVIAKAISSGVKISDSAKILALTLADESFLVRQFSTPDGKRFMRKIAPSAGGYSHLDRLSTIPRGESIILDLIRTKDGDKMIAYLTTTSGGRNMGAMMAQARGGVDLNKPTGRIYTADALVTALKAAAAKH